MADLTDQQIALLDVINMFVGHDPSEKEWSPVMSDEMWSLVRQLPDGLVETHQRFAPIRPVSGGAVLGVGFARLTDAGRAAIAKGEA
ncbi:hypothetical protein ABNQ39_00455 (plasmid) [Azospirillum sp. A26]|uniref:hypothetical protein n=1 Tax=Azospirillum sp. A26 TaxID=3160607 RepID=UPI003671FEFC